MFRLFECGKPPGAIARLCEEGTAGTSPFKIPRRTVHDIVTRMAGEAEMKLPTSVIETEATEAVECYPARIAGIVGDEIKRLEGKQESRGLTLDDFERLKKAAALSFELHKRLSRRRAPATRGARAARQHAGAQQEPESTIERLAREAREQGGEGAQLSCTHTRQQGAVADAKQAADPQPSPSAPASEESGTEDTADPKQAAEAAVAPSVDTQTADPQPPPPEVTSGEHSEDTAPDLAPAIDVDAALAKKSPAERAEAARKARAALARLDDDPR